MKIMKIVRVVIPLVVLVLGVSVFRMLVSTRPEVQRTARVDPGVLVEVTSIEPSRTLVKVQANGEVVPAQQVALAPEVSGRVVWVSPELVPGGRLRAGAQVVRIDARDYRLAAEQQFAQVDRARTELELERGRKKIAEREWELFESDTAAADGLAVRGPQLRTAEVAVQAAESGLRRAQLAVEKTVLTAPFNAVVQGKQVDMGQLVGPQQPLATLVGTDHFWVQASVPIERLAWIRVPGVRGATEGSRVRVWQSIEGFRVERTGRVIRLMGNLDPLGRMARVLVEIEDPLGLAPLATDGAADGDDPRATDLPLLLGSYVNVEIDGREVDGVSALPREALREGDRVYIMTDEDTLEIREVDVLWRRADSVLVRGGLAADDRVVLTPIAAPVEGMRLRVPGAAAPAPAPALEPDAEPKAARTAEPGEVVEVIQ